MGRRDVYMDGYTGRGATQKCLKLHESLIFVAQLLKHMRVAEGRVARGSQG